MTDKLLASVPAQYQNRFERVLETHGEVISSLVDHILNRLENISQKTLPTSSEYVHPKIKPFDIYVRYGANRYGRFGHSYICISNVNVAHKEQGKGLFSALLFSLMYECEQRNIILGVENPLEEKFRKYLTNLGFEAFGDTPLNIGTYYKLLPADKLVSQYPFFNIDPDKFK